MKDFKYKVIFSSKLKVGGGKDKYISTASLEELKQFIPSFSEEKDIDLLPISANAFVANRFNKNGDGIDGETSVKIAKQFINRPINIEHNRERVVGVILNANFSAFGSDKALDEDTLKELVANKKPFNVVLGGVIWKIVNENVAEKIEESNDPESDYYSQVSMSWEVGFSDYDLVVIEGSSKNLEDGGLISDPDNIKTLEANLKQNNGTGTLGDNKFIYRLAKNDVYPLGIGLTEKPAADVSGVAVNTKTSSTLEASSQENINAVNNIENTKEKAIMNITKIEDLTDENLKQVSASEVTRFVKEQIETQLKVVNENKEKELLAKEEELKLAKEKFDSITSNAEELKKQNEQLTAQFEEVNKKLNELTQKEEEREKLLVFSSRMEELDKTYSFEAQEREVIAKDLNDLDDEGYAAFKTKLSVLLKNKVKASESTEKTGTSDSQQVIDTVINNGTKDTISTPNTATVEVTLSDRMKKAFSPGKGINISI